MSMANDGPPRERPTPKQRPKSQDDDTMADRAKLEEFRAFMKDLAGEPIGEDSSFTKLLRAFYRFNELFPQPMDEFLVGKTITKFMSNNTSAIIEVDGATIDIGMSAYIAGTAYEPRLDVTITGIKEVSE